MPTKQIKSPIKEKFNQYPAHIKPLLLNLRELILQCASELKLGEIEESLKWNEPSYKAKSGSPIRIDWKPDTP